MKLLLRPQLNTVFNVGREKRSVVCLVVYLALCTTTSDDTLTKLLKKVVCQQTVQ